MGERRRHEMTRGRACWCGSGHDWALAKDGFCRCTDAKCVEVHERVPKRVRLSRRKGWRKPKDAVVVARPTKWGNPFRVGDTHEAMHWVRGEMEPYVISDRAAATSAFRESIGKGSTFWNDVRRELRGRDLACWCPLDQPCHADVLLEIANADPPFSQQETKQ